VASSRGRGLSHGVPHNENTSDAWFLVTDYDVGAGDVAELKRAGIHYIRLGPKFEEFLQQRNAVPGEAAATL
jgi:hypothetical protein